MTNQDKGYRSCLTGENPPPVLWHYTTLEGLLGIAKERAVWASDARFLNDSREYVHALDLFRTAIDTRTEGANPSDLVALEFMKHLLDVFWSLSEFRVFVASFSASEDQLGQWRAYGASTKGVSIGLDLRAILPEESSRRQVFAPCIYRTDEQEQCIKQWCDEFMVELRELGEHMRPFRHSNEEDQFSKGLHSFGLARYRALSRAISDGARLAALMKHEKFSEENEWRIVIIESRHENELSALEKVVRVGASTFIPYVSVPLNRNETASTPCTSLVKVVVGPHPNPARAADAVREFLLLSSLGHVPVVNSVVPYRTW